MVIWGSWRCTNMWLGSFSTLDSKLYKRMDNMPKRRLWKDLRCWLHLKVRKYLKNAVVICLSKRITWRPSQMGCVPTCERGILMEQTVEHNSENPQWILEYYTMEDELAVGGGVIPRDVQVLARGEQYQALRRKRFMTEIARKLGKLIVRCISERWEWCPGIIVDDNYDKVS